MKYFVIILVLAGFSGSFLFGNQAYALWIPLSPEELLEQSGTIFVGTITAVTPVDVEYQSKIARNGTVKESVGSEVMTLEEYTVDVEEFLQNPQDSNTMKVLRATVGGVPSGPAKISGFEVGDRVLFYLPKDEKQTHFPGQYLPESFEIPKQCGAKSVLEQPRIDGKNSFEIFQDRMLKKDNFTAGTPMKFVFGKDTSTLYGASIDVEVTIGKADENLAVFQKNIHAESEPCQWITSAEWEFTPEEGDYRMSYTIRENEEGGSTMFLYTGFSVITDVHDIMSPLKQFESGISVKDIQCKEGLELILKSLDDSPACVKPETKQILIERGWAEPTKTKIKNSLLPPCTSDRTACFDQESNICDPSGWKCENREVFSKIILLPEFNSYSTIFPYIWNDFIHRQRITFEPKEQSYINTDEGWYSGLNRVCSPIVASNGTEFYISSVFVDEPFEIIGTFIDSTRPDDCHKIWKTEAVLPEPDRELAMWLENYHHDD